MSFDSPDGFMSGLISFALFVVFAIPAFGFLVVGVPRWIGVQCDPWPILGPVLCSIGLILLGGGTWRINHLVAAGFGLVALALLIQAAVVTRRAVIEERAMAAEAKANPPPLTAKSKLIPINRKPPPPIREGVKSRW